MIILTGSNGQLGHDMCKKLEEKNLEFIAIDKNELDITNEHDVLEFVNKIKPTIIIHCAAYTAVDLAEVEIDLCNKVNVHGTSNLVKASVENDCKFIYISTDYVFDGSADGFYEIDSQTNPQSIYGKSKLEGEKIVKEYLDKYFIIRISWAFGINGNNFINTVAKIAKEKTEIKVVEDQVGSVTYTDNLSDLICEMLQTDKYGIYHATNEGITNWAEIAEETIKLLKLDCKVIRIKSKEFPTKAVRPLNSKLSKESLALNGFSKLPNWKTALNDYINKKFM